VTNTSVCGWYSPTKKQFKEFIKNDGFTDSEKFVRKKKNAL
jgi:hypothetical protein